MKNFLKQKVVPAIILILLASIPILICINIYKYQIKPSIDSIIREQKIVNSMKHARKEPVKYCDTTSYDTLVLSKKDFVKMMKLLNSRKYIKITVTK